MDNLRAGLTRAVDTIVEYREGLPESHVAPLASRASVRQALGELPDGPAGLDEVIDELLERAPPGLMASAGPRYYGFVIGGSLDAALVADVITSGWDQCAYNVALSPAAIAFEDVAGSWIKELLGLPATASVGFATGGQGANTVGIAAGRWQVLHRRGWDVGRDGLHGAPQIRVVVGAERHATIDRSVRLLGLGENAIVVVPPLPNGAMDTHALRDVLGDDNTAPTIVCAAAGNVNTGACDDMTAVVEAARTVGAWVHVDGAFGLWAAASPRTAHLVRGIELAIRGRATGTSGLTSPTTRAMRSVRIRRYTRRHWRTRRRISRARWRGASSAVATSSLSRHDELVALRPGQPCDHSAARVSPTSSTAVAMSRVASPSALTSSKALRSSTTSSSIRCSSA